MKAKTPNPITRENPATVKSIMDCKLKPIKDIIFLLLSMESMSRLSSSDLGRLSFLRFGEDIYTKPGFYGVSVSGFVCLAMTICTCHLNKLVEQTISVMCFRGCVVGLVLGLSSGLCNWARVKSRFYTNLILTRLVFVSQDNIYVCVYISNKIIYKFYSKKKNNINTYYVTKTIMNS